MCKKPEPIGSGMVINGFTLTLAKSMRSGSETFRVHR